MNAAAWLELRKHPAKIKKAVKAVLAEERYKKQAKLFKRAIACLQEWVLVPEDIIGNYGIEPKLILELAAENFGISDDWKQIMVDDVWYLKYQLYANY